MLRPCLFLVLCFAADTAPETSSAKDVQAFQGKWKVVKMEVAGEAWSADALGVAKVLIVFDEGQMRFVKKGKDVEKTKYTLDADKKNKTIDTIDSEGRLEKGIYELDGDTLRICIAQTSNDRPMEFKSLAKPATSLFTLQRIPLPKD